MNCPPNQQYAAGRNRHNQNRSNQNRHNRNGANRSGDRADMTVINQIDLKEVKPELFSVVAKTVADKLKEAGKDKNKASQIRKFYDEVCMLEEQLNACTDANERNQKFNRVILLLHMLVPKAVYAQERKHVDANFVEMIKKCVNQVGDSDELRNFRMFFEAVIAYTPKK